MVKVKICGITNLEDAAAAVKAGADALGFVFYRKSPRFVKPQTAAQIMRQLPARVKKIGVFVNARPATIKRYAAQCRFDIAQLHGNESPRHCSCCRPVRVIKAFRVRGAVDIGTVAKYKTFGYLFDAYVPGTPGGTGRVFDWSFMAGVSRLHVPGGIFLSGGLNSRNVGNAIRIARPQWVDASSSLESAPGRKDRRRMAAFIRIVKRTRVKS